LVFGRETWAQKTNLEVLQELEALRGKPLVVPSPKSPIVLDGPTVGPSSDTGQAKRNLKDFEADRTQRQILEQLK
jgi:hypothetical protein